MTDNIYKPQIHTELADSVTDEREVHALERRQLDVQASLRERMASLESDTKRFATREDIANAKLWAVTSVLGALVTVIIAVSVVIARFWPV